MISKGVVIDNLWFSMLDQDWDVVKQAFVKWLDPSNFDERGIQKERLSDIRMRLKASLNGCFFINFSVCCFSYLHFLFNFLIQQFKA